MDTVRPSLERVAPLNILAGLTVSAFGRARTADLIYSYNHLVHRKTPWVLFAEWFQVVIGRDIRLFPIFKRYAERFMKSDNCKAITTWSESARQSILANYDTKSYCEKIHIIPLAVPPRRIKRTYNSDRVRLLFVGSPDASDDFYIKGGLDLLAAYEILCGVHKNVDLVVRAKVPTEVKKSYANLRNLRFIDEPITWDDLEKEFTAADIFVQPTHDTPFGAFLDAMSYGLPVITRRAHLNQEIVSDGKEGYLVDGQRKVKYFCDIGKLRMVPVTSTLYRRHFMNEIAIVDKAFVRNYVEKLEVLIEDEHLRRQMGWNAKEAVEFGRFSLTERNNKLKKVFDQAIT